MSENRANCRNCGEALVGLYCSHCGQREGRGDLSFGEVAGELLDEVVSWDSRLWRTLLPLLFRPGFLTAEFIAGRRARYVPPFRLYLVISFVLFLVVSLLAGDTTIVRTNDGLIVNPGASVAVDGGAVGAGDEPDTDDFNVEISLAEEGSPQWLKDLDKRLEKNAERLSDDPSEFIQLWLEYLPQMMFLLLPVFALLLKFCYFFSPYHYLQHLVFSLHFHSFVYLLYLLGQLGGIWLRGSAVAEVFPLLVLVYLPMALMRAYNSSLAGAAGKAFFVIIVDAFLLVVAFAMITVMALALM